MQNFPQIFLVDKTIGNSPAKLLSDVPPERVFGQARKKYAENWNAVHQVNIFILIFDWKWFDCYDPLFFLFRLPFAINQQ